MRNQGTWRLVAGRAYRLRSTVTAFAAGCWSVDNIFPAACCT